MKQKKSNSPAQHHLPALDLFWANLFLRVQLTSLSLQLISLLMISPGLCTPCLLTYKDKKEGRDSDCPSRTISGEVCVLEAMTSKHPVMVAGQAAIRAGDLLAKALLLEVIEHFLGGCYSQCCSRFVVPPTLPLPHPHRHPPA